MNYQSLSKAIERLGVETQIKLVAAPGDPTNDATQGQEENWGEPFKASIQPYAGTPPGKSIGGVKLEPGNAIGYLPHQVFCSEAGRKLAHNRGYFLVQCGQRYSPRGKAEQIAGENDPWVVALEIQR